MKEHENTRAFYLYMLDLEELTNNELRELMDPYFEILSRREEEE